MNPEDLLNPVFLKPLWRSGAVAFVLWLVVWWREKTGRSSLPLAAAGLAWACCHLFVSFHSNQFPPKQSEDWLVFGAAGVFLTGVVAWFLRGKRVLPTGLISALLLLAVAWLAFRQLPYLFDRGETLDQRRMRTGIGLAAVLLTFAGAEWTARKAKPAAVLAAMAVFAFLAAVSLVRLVSPENAVARALAAGSAAAAGAVAALLRRENAATLPGGVAGWFSGGVLILFAFGCLSRASDVPIEPLVAGAAVFPAAAIILALHARLFIAGQGLTLIAAVLAGGSALLFYSAKHQNAAASAPPAIEENGADDTGAYD